MNIDQELTLLRYYSNIWPNIYPYEKEYFIRRTTELVLQNQAVLGPDLTLRTLATIHSLTILR